MRKRFSFELKIAGILVFILTLVVVTGILTYQRFSGIVTEVSQDLRPDSRLITVKGLQNQLNNAEISVKSFRITADTVYLSDFYSSVQAIDEQLSVLHDLQNDSLFAEQAYPGELDTLINQKIYILNSLLVLQDGFRTQKALDKVVNEIEGNQEISTTVNAIEDTTLVSEKEDKMFGWLFKKKNIEESPPPIIEEIFTDTVVTMEAVNREIRAIKSQELRSERRFRERELELILQDQMTTEQIKVILNAIEAEEIQRIKDEAVLAETVIADTNQQIIYFCIVLGILLLFMAVVILNYIKNNNRYRKALRKSKEEAEELAHMKEQFLANMSHEMRTPMNAVAGFSEQISQGPLTNEQQEQIGMVQKSADHLLHLINEILDFSKINAERISLEKINFEPKKIIENVANTLGLEAEKKKLDTEIKIHSQLPKNAIGDPYRLQQILLNLVGNAIKFTEQGSIGIIAEPVMLSTTSFHLKVQVKDTGIGIAEKNIGKIFQAFEQATISTTRNFGGTGLGLSIVKQLVDLHHGKIHVRSKLEKGTIITIEIPYKIGTIEPSSLSQKKENHLPFTNQQILVADDEEFNRLLITRILKKQNVQFTTVSNGKEVLEELENNPYDLILMDIRMPEKDGVETTKIIRESKNESIRLIPIIALTAGVSENERANYRAAGMNGFLPKPFKENELIREMQRCITGMDVLEEIRDEPDEITSSKIDLRQLAQLSNGDQAFFTDMLETFIKGTEEGVEGIEAAYAEKNWNNMAEYAHKISSPCKMLGAKELYAGLKKIESNCRNQENLEDIPALLSKIENESNLILELVRKEIKNG